MPDAVRVDISVYRELINLFFNSQSYFYLTLSDMLKNKIHNEAVISDDELIVIRKFLNKLIQVEDSYAELDKISTVAGFEDFQDKLIQYISNLSLRGSDEQKRKELIASVSQFFLEKIITISKDNHVREKLANFLGIKNYQLSQHNASNNINKNNRSETVNPHLTDSGTSSNVEELTSDFHDDILKTVASLQNILSAANSNENNAVILSKCVAEFESLKFNAMMWGFENVEAISDRMIKVTRRLRVSQKKSISDLAELFEFTSGYLQQKSIEQQDKQVDNVIKILDHYLESGEFTFEMRESDEDSNEPVVEAKSSDETEAKDDISMEQDNLSQFINDSDDNNFDYENFKLPGEDDPELQWLINEVMEPKQKNDEDEDKDNNADTHIIREIKIEPPEDAVIEPDTADPVRLLSEADVGNFQIFVSETSMYFKLLKSALDALARNPEDDSALEDIELASFSLKSQSLKLGFEKLSQIPNAIEEIANYSIKYNIQLAPQMVKIITKSIILLQSFHNKKDEQNQFRDLLSKLNLYFQKLRHKVKYGQ